MGDYGILGAQWTSFDNGLTWTRFPPPVPQPANSQRTFMTAVAVNFTRGEVTFRIDLEKVFGVPPPPIVHAIAEDNRGGIKATAVCGQIVMHFQMGGRTVPYDDRSQATCEACRHG